MYDEIYQQVELSPDLDWMLLSDQVSDEAVLEKIVADHYRTIYQIALVIWGEAEEARKSTRRALSYCILNRHRYLSGSGIEAWVYGMSLKALRGGRRIHVLRRIFYPNKGERREAQENPPAPALPEGLSSAQFARMKDWDSQATENQRLAFLFCDGIGLPPEKAAEVLGIGEYQIRTWLEEFHQIMNAEMDAELPDGVFHQFVQFLWPVPVLTDQESLDLVSSITGKGPSWETQRSLGRFVREASWALAILVLVIMTARLLNQLYPEPQPVQAIYNPLPTLEAYLPSRQANSGSIGGRSGLSAGAISPLTEKSSSDRIALRLWESSQLWDTLWLDAKVTLFGAQGFLGEPVSQHVELWMEKGGPKNLIVVGNGSGKLVEAYLGVQRHFYQLNLQNGMAMSASLVSPHIALRGLYLVRLIETLAINPFESGVRYKVIGSETIAGRNALVVEMVNSNGQIQGRAWVDKQTGFPLRQQRFGRFYTQVLMDIVTNQIAYNQPIPESVFSLDFPRPIGFMSDPPTGQEQPDEGKSLAAMSYPYVPPPRYDLAHSRLNFQFLEVYSNNDVRNFLVNLFADGYYLGKSTLSYPWDVFCSRSPDGKRIAFIEDRRFQWEKDFPSMILRWLQLEDLHLHTPLPDLTASYFAFAPDSRRLAVFASRGLYIVDLDTGSYENILMMENARSLVWSPDGRYLAMIASGMAPETRTEVVVLDVLQRKVVYRQTYDVLMPYLSRDWPVVTWGVRFPVDRTYGLESCSLPPP